MALPDSLFPPGAVIRSRQQLGIVLAANGGHWWENASATIAMTITYGPGQEHGRLWSHKPAQNQRQDKKLRQVPKEAQ